jgi:preprotein translocase subunit SecD
MTRDQKPRGELEENVRRLFGRLEREGPMSETTRDRILERLLQEASPPPSKGTGRVVRRGIRWASLAAALFVAAGLLTVYLDDPGGSRGRRIAEERAGAVTAESSADVTLVSFAIHLLARGPGRGVVEASSAEGGEPVHIHPERHVSNADVESAWVKQADSGCQVEIRLTEEGAEKLARLTRDHIGERLALVIDGVVIMTPTIRSRLGGLVLLTGRSSDFPCEEIARGLSTSS